MCTSINMTHLMQLIRLSLGKGSWRRSVHQVLMLLYAQLVVIQCWLMIWLQWFGKMVVFGSLQWRISSLWFCVCWVVVLVGISVFSSGFLLLLWVLSSGSSPLPLAPMYDGIMSGIFKIGWKWINLVSGHCVLEDSQRELAMA